MDKIRVNKKEKFEIKIPTLLQVGDPMYFERYGESFEYVYSKRFGEKKDWVGKLIVTESVDIELAKMFGKELPATNFISIFAPTKKLLEIYENNLHYKDQKIVTTQIGVDTARYLVSTNKRCIEINTGCDGIMGEIMEIYKGSKLEGVIVSLTGLDVNTFEDFKDDIKYVFGL